MHANEWLVAGGYLLKEWTSKKDVVDQIDARVFTHPAMPDREIVRLTPSPLADGEDSAMDILGFKFEESNEGVAFRKRQALGFPDYVLVNHPEDAKLALNTARSLKKLMRGAKSKPGNAKDMVLGLTKSIETSSPHFLPSMHEEIARLFLEAGNTTYASTFFGKAREAEQMYALPVDEERRRDAFVEFALNGALTNKVMTQYAKVLTEEHGPDQAYEYFFDLCVRRTLGGTPISAQLVTDLRKLARGAKRNAAEEDERFISEVWESPALAFSATKFWETYSKTFKGLLKTLGALSGRLLNLWPRPSSGGDGFKEFWLEFLRDLGIWKALTDPKEKVADADAPEESAAAWMDKLITRSMKTGWGGWNTPDLPDTAFELLRQMAARLKADDIQIKIQRSYAGGDADFLDLALELGVPVDAENSGFRLNVWMNAPADSKERLRDLRFIAEDSRFDQIMDHAVSEVFSNVEFQTLAAGKPGLEKARRKWLEERVDQMEQGYFPEWMTHAATLSDIPAATFGEFPVVYERLTKLNPIPSFRRSLKLGLMDELVWREFEAAKLELSTKNKDELYQHFSFPYAYVYNRKQIIVVGPNGRELKHDFAFKWSRNYSVIRTLKFAKGQLLVAYYDDSWNTKAYWSGNPKDTWELNSWLSTTTGAILEDGRVFEGFRAFGPPDKELPGTGVWFSDGTTFWRAEGWGESAKVIEIDPLTGRAGRNSLPKFFEDLADSEHKIEASYSSLYPIPAGFKSLLTNEPFWGVCVRSKLPEGRWTCSLYNGESFDRHDIYGRVQWPGAEQSVLVNPSFQVLDEDGELVSESHISLQTPFWHALEWRDAQASKTLRKLDDAVLYQWLVIAFLDEPGANAQILSDPTKEALGTFLDSIGASTDAKLLKQVKTAVAKGEDAKAGVLQKAIRESLDGCDESLAAVLAMRFQGLRTQIENLFNLLTMADPENAVAQISAKAIIRNVALLRQTYYSYYHDKLDFSVLLDLLVHATEGRDADFSDLHYVTAEFFAALLEPGSLYWLGTRSDEREAFALLLEALSDRLLFHEYEHRRVSYVDLDAQEHLLSTLKIEDEYFVVQYRDLKSGPALILKLGGEPYGYVIYQWSKKPLGPLEIAAEFSRDWNFPEPEEVERWADSLRGGHEVEIDTEALEGAAQTAGVSYPEFALLWAGAPNWQDWNKNFLPKELRETLKLKVAEADKARQVLRDIIGFHLIHVFHESVSVDTDVYTQKGMEVLAEHLADLYKSSDALDGVVLEALESLGWYGARDTFSRLLEPGGAFETKPSFSFKKREDKTLYCEQVGPTFIDIEQALRLAFGLALALPGDHEARGPIKAALKRLPDIVKDPNFVVSVGNLYGYEYEKKAIDERLSLLGMKADKPLDDGVTLAVLGSWGVEFFFRPASYLAGEKNVHLERLSEPNFRPIDYIVSSDFELFLNSLDSGFDYDPHNPSLSAPDVLKDVSKTLKLSDDAAQLFLQTLALVDLKSATVKRINGWSTKEYKAACDELTKAKLLVEAKRARAGRSHFLDGPWMALKSPLLPIESWKASLYGCDPYGNAPYGFVPNIPMPEFFRRTWERYKSGDKPGF